MSLFNVEQGPKLSDIFARSTAKAAAELNGKALRYMGSGKAAIAIILEFLRHTGEMPDKMAEVVVPSWIGNPVYQQVNWFGFPTLQVGPKAKVLMAYHQYGFPQNLDRVLDFARQRKLIVIEDCAHACDSTYRGQALGGFGRFAIYSFSKFAFCYALGGVGYREPDFERFIDERLRSSSRMARGAINAFKFADEANFSRRAPLFLGAMTLLRKMAFAVYGDAHHPSARAIALWESKKERELASRRRHYRLFREATDSLGVCDHLEKDGVTPYVIPIRFAEERMPALVERLLSLGYKTGIYHFDFNRCLLEPDFRKIVMLPCHGGLTDNDLDKIIEAVRQAAGGRR